MSQVARISRPARHGYTRPAGRRCEATSTATNSCRTTTVSTTPMTIEINHAGKKDPRMLTDGDTPQPGRAVRLAAASERIGRPTVASEDVMRDLASLRIPSARQTHSSGSGTFLRQHGISRSSQASCHRYEIRALLVKTPRACGSLVSLAGAESDWP